LSDLTPSGGVSNDELNTLLYDDLGPSSGRFNDLDKYMVEPLLKQSEFDIVAQWKNNKRGISRSFSDGSWFMAIQVSIVALESTFSVGV
jgi:hypothetical protein